MTQVRVRKDLAEQNISIPAGMTYRDYDDLLYVQYFNADDLDGAIEWNTGEDPDSHAFCPVKLKDGRVLYFIGVDLDWTNE